MLAAPGGWKIAALAILTIGSSAEGHRGRTRSQSSGFRSFSSGGGGGRGYNSVGGGGISRSSNLKAEYDRIWTSTGTVPDKLSRVPDNPLFLNFNGLNVQPNMTLDTAQILDKPTIRFDHEKGELYTLIIEDNDITNQPIKYAHWLVTNIPGDNICQGDAVVDWIPSYHFSIKEDGTLDTQDPKTNRHLVLVYKQKNRKRLDLSGSAGCNKEILRPPRVNDHDELQLENDLEGPVAGTFYRIGYSRGWTEYHVCRNRRCLGMPLPGIVPGVNDKPECISPEERNGGGGSSSSSQSSSSGQRGSSSGGNRYTASSNSGGRGTSSLSSSGGRYSSSSSSSGGSRGGGGGRYSSNSGNGGGGRYSSGGSGGRYSSG